MSEVIIVGSGPSGLAAAFRLQRAGHRVRILERAQRAGSTMMSERRDGFLIDRGAFFIPTTHRPMLRVADEAGIADQLHPGGDVFAAARGGQLHRLDAGHMARTFAQTRLISGWAKLGAVRLAPEVIRARRATMARIAEAGRYDSENLSAWARRTQNPEVAEFLIDSAVRSMYAAEPENLSRVEFLGVIALFGGAKLVAFQDGMAGYSAGLASRFEITLGAEVNVVEPTADGAEVTWTGAHGERTERVAGCVIAVPARVATALLPRLDDWRRHYLNRVPAGRLVLAHVALGRRPDLDATYAMIPRSEHPFLAGIVCDHNKASGRAPAGKGLLTLPCTTEWSEPHFEDDDDSLAGAAIAAAERFLPGIADLVEFTTISRWAQQYPPVGHYAGLGEFTVRSLRADRTVQLCGEYMSTPHMATATGAGERAARELMRHLV
jgi:protoporphyrinogen/coproporphyrinogen III oxidase